MATTISTECRVSQKGKEKSIFNPSSKQEQKQPQQQLTLEDLNLKLKDIVKRLEQIEYILYGEIK